jgi:hypothetical protein
MHELYTPQTLFDLADAAMTTFEVTGAGWPYCNQRRLLGEQQTVGFFDGVERILGAFKRRYEKERGPTCTPGRVQILLKFVPNVFSEAWLAGGAAGAAAAAEAYVERARANIFGPDAGSGEGAPPEPLDLVQLEWMDFKGADPLPVLRALQRMTTDQLEVSGRWAMQRPRPARELGG